MQMPETDDPDLAALAADLRQLRLDAGNPTLHTLSSATGISRTVLSETFNGRQLPSENTLYRLAKHFDVDPETWLRRRAEALRAASGGADADGEDAPERPGGLGRLLARRVTLGTMALGLGLTAVLAVAGTLAAQRAIGDGWPGGAAAADIAPSPSEEQYADAANGVDPMTTRCREDSVIAASEQRLDGKVQVQMLYSNSCMAAWGRVTRYDEAANGNYVEMRVYPESDPEGDRAQRRRTENVQSLYTPMLMEPDVEARVCGIASVAVDGRSEELGPEICI